MAARNPHGTLLSRYLCDVTRSGYDAPVKEAMAMRTPSTFLRACGVAAVLAVVLFRQVPPTRLSSIMAIRSPAAAP